MNKYIKYLKYVLKHKWYVMLECFKNKLFIKGITHDISKFLPSEFIPYARYFYGYPNTNDIPFEVENDFDVAWLKHIHRNKHHWQHWILHEDCGNTKFLFIPYNYTVEMYCDWIGAGIAITGTNNIKEWFEENKNNIRLSRISVVWLRDLIYSEPSL